MKILIVSATQAEIQPLLDHFSVNPHFDHLVTGVGMVATAFALGNHLAKHTGYNLAINAGIAGTFDHNIPLGEVVLIKEDTFSELGAQDNEHFLTLEDLGFGKSTFQSSYELPASSLKKVKAVTVNQVHGHDASIKQITGRLQPQLESMEGAAFFYACHHHNIPCLQIRAVSNYVEKRNRANWQIGLAVNNLNKALVEIIGELKNNTAR